MARKNIQLRGDGATNELANPIRCVDVELNVKGIVQMYAFVKRAV